MAPLLRIRPPQAREVSRSLGQPIPDTEILTHPASTADAPDGPGVPLREGGLQGVGGPGQPAGPGGEPPRVQPGLRVEEDGCLAGQLTMVDLALLPEQTLVREVMDPVPAAVNVAPRRQNVSGSGVITT